MKIHTGLFLLLIAETVDAFSPVGPLQSSRQFSSTTFLTAKKNRRVRKKDSQVAKSNPPPPVASTPSIETPPSFDNDELPEFDLFEDGVEDTSASSSTSSSSAASSMASTASEAPNTLGEDFGDLSQDPLVMEAMKAGPSSSNQVVSGKDLLRTRDREMESKFEFGEVAKPLPKASDFLSKNSNRGGVQAQDPAAPMGKKRARDEARRAAAIQAASEAGEEEGDLLSRVVPTLPSSIPYVGTKEGEELTPIKVSRKILYLYFIFFVKLKKL